MNDNHTEIFCTVRDVYEACLCGTLTLEYYIDDPARLEIKVSIPTLRASYAFRDRVPFWYEYRDYVVANWPADADRRELYGLTDPAPQ
jgi:hypothetical protein